MKVLLWMPAHGEVPGGHCMQFDHTAAALRSRGLDIAVSVAREAEVRGFHVVHGFGLDPRQIRDCRAVGAKVALSTIYSSLDYTRDQRPWPTRIRFGLAFLQAALRGHYRDKCVAMSEEISKNRTIFEMADVLLPNSEAEGECICRELRITTPMHVVPNAVDDSLFTPPPEGTERPIDVLFVGRFEPHKNQLGLIRAMRGTRWRTVLTGPPHPHHPEYYRQCHREATDNVSIAPAVPHQHLATLYRQAAVHVLPSWFETTGLVSLEAALCGCKIVTTDRGFAKDYFGDFATYCNPNKQESIRNAVATALASPIDTRLRSHILANYTWRHTAQATAAAYESIL